MRGNRQLAAPTQCAKQSAFGGACGARRPMVERRKEIINTGVIGAYLDG